MVVSKLNCKTKKGVRRRGHKKDVVRVAKTFMVMVVSKLNCKKSKNKGHRRGHKKDVRFGINSILIFKSLDWIS